MNIIVAEPILLTFFFIDYATCTYTPLLKNCAQECVNYALNCAQ